MLLGVPSADLADTSPGETGSRSRALASAGRPTTLTHTSQPVTFFTPSLVHGKWACLEEGRKCI